MTSTVGTPFNGLALKGSLRPFQQLAIDSFERDRAAGRTTTHLVAPPGSGKTVIGLEIVRRLGHPALVLAPTATIQAQWSDKLALFTDDPHALTTADGPLHVLTYQSVCQTSDPGGALRDEARARLIEERALTTGTPIGEMDAQTKALTGTARNRFDREVAAEVARTKRAVARGEHLHAGLEHLIAPNARQRIEQLARTGVRTVVLDECHHLASLWGYLVRTILAALGDVHVVGLTATSPSELTGEDAALYQDLLGPVDFEVPTPAVVRDGHLAPYQELAFFTTPLRSEKGWLDERHARFAEMLDRLHDPPPPGEEDLAFGPWVIGRMRYRDSGDGAARVPFATLAARRPEVARAGLRYLHAGDLELPDDAPRGEGWREPPTLDDWLALIGDYALGCLRASPGTAADRRFDELHVALRDLGFSLTRQGVRRGGSEVDRVLTTSAAKPIGATEVIAAEAEARGEALRAVVLCDTERGERQPEGSPLALSGGARGVLRTFGGDVRTEALHPLLVSGRTVACLPSDAPRFAQALNATDTEIQDGIAVLTRPGWDSREWVAAAGVALASGTTSVVIGTRGLLGEGWDAPTLNVLVDLTTVAADVSVRQMRGRALRLDPADPDKLSSNWDVVCVAPDLARGTADYERFVRRHAHLQAPCEDGSIETGVSHVHPDLSPYLPPPEADFTPINAGAVARATDRLGARERWQIGSPYVGEEVPVLLVRTAGGRKQSAPPAASQLKPPSPRGPLLPFRLARARDAYPEVLPLDRVAHAIVVAYADLEEITAQAAASLTLSPRPGGAIRCALPLGDARENALLAAALEEAISPALGQRYVVSRPVWPDGRGGGAVALRALTFRAPLDTAWHPVPSDLGSHKNRAERYHAAWAGSVGPGELLFAGREDSAGRERRAAASSARADYVASRRVLWH